MPPLTFMAARNTLLSGSLIEKAGLTPLPKIDPYEGLSESQTADRIRWEISQLELRIERLREKLP